METHQTSLVILLLILIFAVIHSGGAALRNKAESIMGPRLWRLCFVFLSLPSAIILISYFLAHRYDGIRLWNFQGNNFVFMYKLVLALNNTILPFFALIYGPITNRGI